MDDGSLETDFKHKRWFERDREIFELRRILYRKTSVDPRAMFEELASAEGNN